MNAEQHQNPALGEITAVHAQSLGGSVALSAMVDGELEAGELDAMLESLEADALSSWHAYQVIGDVLRGHGEPTGTRPAAEFLAAVRIGLKDRDADLNGAPRLAAETITSMSGPLRRDAANDAIFRWKLVAGFASLAAVLAVSWTVVSGSGSSGDAGAQLASNAPVSVATSTAPAVGAPVAVSTGQGVVIRDAQLEALLAEHRQHGGMSALQMPSGFIRNATYESAGR